MPEGLADGDNGAEENAMPTDAKARPSEERSSKGQEASMQESASASGLTRRLSVARADPVDKVKARSVALHVRYKVNCLEWAITSF